MSSPEERPKYPWTDGVRCLDRTGDGRYQCALTAGHPGKHRVSSLFLEWDNDPVIPESPT